MQPNWALGETCSVGPHDFMAVARDLAEADRALSLQARLRRAVSTAYYALFHCLAASAADLFIGRERNPAWHRTYRALEHRRARSECRQVQAMPEFPAGIRDFAEAFVALQKARQDADYALDMPAYEQSDVLGYVASAEIAIRQFERAPVEARRSFVAQVLFRQRSS